MTRKSREDPNNIVPLRPAAESAQLAKIRRALESLETDAARWVANPEQSTWMGKVRMYSQWKDLMDDLPQLDEQVQGELRGRLEALHCKLEEIQRRMAEELASQNKIKARRNQHGDAREQRRAADMKQLESFLQLWPHVRKDKEQGKDR